MQEYITVGYALVLTLSQSLLGYLACKKTQGFFTDRLRNEKPEATPYLPFYWLLGLLLHLSLLLLFKSLGAPWWLATALPFMLVIVFWREGYFFLRSLSFAQLFRKLACFSFLIWLLVHILLGVSLFSFEGEINTPWVNNYGDLTFHLGMIRNFLLSSDFPPDYHLYAGESLSYPFFVNLWAASLWVPSGTMQSLSVIFAFQWVILWSCVYFFLNASRAVFLPWVLLLGGGSYLAIMFHADHYSWQLINRGYPWTTWLSTIWVTQRSALMGLVTCLASCALVFNLCNLPRYSIWNTALAGAILGLSPLVHTHYFAVTAVFLGAYLFLSSCHCAMTDRRINKKNLLQMIFIKEEHLRFLALFLPSLSAIVFFPMLLGKSGMVDFMLGWMVPTTINGWVSIHASILMWLKNAFPWFMVFAVIFIFSAHRLAMALILSLFLLANFVKLAVWDWDQLKVFLAITTLFIAVWAKDYSAWTHRWKIPAGCGLALLLIGPGLYEAGRIWKHSQTYQVYDPTKIELAEIIKKTVPAHVVIASPPDHNSAATLSGRSLFFGYPGTLASHSIDYRDREAMHLSLERLRHCAQKISEKICPQYVIWGASAAKYWRRKVPGEGFHKISETGDGRYRVYKIIPGGE